MSFPAIPATFPPNLQRAGIAPHSSSSAESKSLSADGLSERNGSLTTIQVNPIFTGTGTSSGRAPTKFKSGEVDIASVYSSSNSPQDVRTPSITAISGSPIDLCKLLPTWATAPRVTTVIATPTAIAMLFDPKTRTAASGAIATTIVSAFATYVIDYASGTTDSLELTNNAKTIFKSAVYGLVLGELASNSDTKTGAVAAATMWGAATLVLSMLHVHESRQGSERMPPARESFANFGPQILGASVAFGVFVALADTSPESLIGSAIGVGILAIAIGITRCFENRPNHNDSTQTDTARVGDADADAAEEIPQTEELPV